MLTLISEATESATTGGINPYVVGAIAMTIAVILITGLLAFGKGREHS